MYSFYMLVIVFFIYSVIGYLIEVSCCSFCDKKLTLSRGYLIGPYLPIFGFGAVGMIYLLEKYQNDLITLFINSMVICCLLEYFTSLILEKIFKLRWWDYSDKKFNINGRICLENGVLFGLAGVVIVKLFHPLLMDLLHTFSNTTIYILGITFLVIIISDFILSTFTISKLKIDTNKFINKDNTAIIREELLKSLKRYQFFYKRIYDSFPNIRKNTKYSKFHDYFKEQRKLWKLKTRKK